MIKANAVSTTKTVMLKARYRGHCTHVVGRVKSTDLWSWIDVSKQALRGAAARLGASPDAWSKSQAVFVVESDDDCPALDGPFIPGSGGLIAWIK
jgi:hypothetical protein